MNRFGIGLKWLVIFCTLTATCSLAIPASAQQKNSNPQPAGFLNGFRFSSGCGISSTPAIMVQHFGDLAQGPSEHGKVCTGQISHTVTRGGGLEFVAAYENMTTRGTGPYAPNNVSSLLPEGILSQETAGTEKISDKALGLGIAWNALNTKNYLLTLQPMAYWHWARETFTGRTKVTALDEDGFQTDFTEPSGDFRKSKGLRGSLGLSFFRMFGDVGIGPGCELGPSSFWKCQAQMTYTFGRSNRYKNR